MPLNPYWTLSTSAGNTFGVLNVLNGGTGLEDPGVTGNTLASNGDGFWYLRPSVFTVNGNLIGATGAFTLMMWQAPMNCTLTGLFGYVTTTSGSTINALHNSSSILSSDYTLTATNTWLSATGLSATPIYFAENDTLTFKWNSVVGNPIQILIQANFIES